MNSPTAELLGEIGLPVPVRELAARTWDVIIVGAGHNGLACAAYLARNGQRVLVLESRNRVGGACTIEQPFPETHVALRLSRRTAASQNCRRARTPRSRISLDPRCQRPFRPHARRLQHPAMG